MKSSYVILIFVAVLGLSTGLSKKKSTVGSLPWPDFPFKRPPTGYFPPLEASDDYYYYENYDLGEGDELDNLLAPESKPNKKPDRKTSTAFKSGIASSIHDFTFDLFTTLVTNKTSENIVISPLSVYTALSMLTLGLGGNSKAQALTVLHGQNLEDIHSDMEELSDALFSGDRDNVTLTQANRIFVDRTIQLYKSFKKSMNEEYHVSAKKVDFIRAPNVNRRRINAFVKRHTNQKIRNLAPPGSITSDTRLFIANAMHMKAFWATPFRDAVNQKFHVNAKESVSALSMSSIGPCSLTTDNNLRAEVVRNQLKGRLSMVMIIPESVGDFSRLEDARGKERVRRALESLYDTDNGMMSFCQIRMPKFKIDYANDLVGSLSDMGMSDVFEATKADLSGMTPSYHSLFVSDIRHKASIDVNEHGIEGSAHTTIVISQRMMPRSVPVDRPFMFIVRDDDTGATIFAGKVLRPSYS